MSATNMRLQNYILHEITKKRDIPGMIFLIDFEKAFDKFLKTQFFSKFGLVLKS